MWLSTDGNIKTHPKTTILLAYRKYEWIKYA